MSHSSILKPFVKRALLASAVGVAASLVGVKDANATRLKSISDGTICMPEKAYPTGTASTYLAGVTGLKLFGDATAQKAAICPIPTGTAFVELHEAYQNALEYVHLRFSNLGSTQAIVNTSLVAHSYTNDMYCTCDVVSQSVQPGSSAQYLYLDPDGTDTCQTCIGDTDWPAVVKFSVTGTVELKRIRVYDHW
jgi:hypothetical protein